MTEFAAILVIAALVGVAVYALVASCIESGAAKQSREPVDDATAGPDRRDRDERGPPRA